MISPLGEYSFAQVGRRLRLIAFSAFLLSTFAIASYYITSPPTVAAATSVFINEIHYDNAGTDTGEAIEVAGPSGTNLTGWSIVLYNGSGGAVYNTKALSGVIPNQQNGFGTLSFTYPTDGIQNGSPDGIALVNGTTVIQFLSYEGTFTAVGGPANGMVSTDIGVAELTTTPIGQSLRLSGTGCMYEDFTWNAAAASSFGSVNTGQTSTCGGVDAAPAVTTAVPANGATNVVVNSNITINFSEPVNVTGSWFTIVGSLSGSHTASASGGPTSFTLDPTSDFVNNETVTVTIVASQVMDQDVNDPPDLMAANFVFSFSTPVVLICGNPATLIHNIQGSGATSPMAGSIVEIEGIVVGDYQAGGQFSGFFVQEEDADADADPATSEGIFVFHASTPVSVGDKVRAKGTVFEFGTAGFTLTELTSVSTVTVCSSGNSLPTSTTVTLPVASLTDWERYEGMLINITQDLTVTDNFTLGRFGEVGLSVDGRCLNPTNITTPGAAAIAQQDLNDRRRIVLDDANNNQNIDPTLYPTGGLSAFNTLRVGYKVSGGLSGVK